MPGLLSFIGALADDLSAVATKVAAGSIDDIANQTSKSLSSTAGILIDDTATIPQYVSNTAAKRELPVIWKITKKSLRNKAIMIPIAILITYFAPFLMAPVLILGGLYLSYEGSESLAEKTGLIKPPKRTGKHSIRKTRDLSAAEDDTVASAVRTDTILSIEIIALTISTVVNEPILNQFIVLFFVAIIATIGVYGIVALIIKMDDIGFHLRDNHDSPILIKFGISLINLMPRVLTSLGWIGMIAMFMVGGGILIHNIPLLHHLIELTAHLPQLLTQITNMFLLPVSISLMAGSLLVFIHHLKSHYA